VTAQILISNDDTHGKNKKLSFGKPSQKNQNVLVLCILVAVTLREEISVERRLKKWCQRLGLI
jgi:hypothetical protein